MNTDTSIAAAHSVLGQSEQLLDAEAVVAALGRVAAGINDALRAETVRPLALVLMRGGLVFAGQLLTRIEVPVDIDYVDASRYGGATRGGEILWRTPVPASVAGRTVLIVDDVLDEGITLAAVKAAVLSAGAHRALIAVFAEKRLARPKPVAADFCGVMLPDRYVFGYGMDVKGLWRNLPAVYALRKS
ncbi:MAG: hypoxanthine-guanine phosphoribosyltransferase [Betaproteobacteria bacterium]|nr:hypoxanthine-guanine phosphoribosyltransferase [Betaproteobacteria bacterium]